MEKFWEEHGCASSSYGMANAIRRYFPNKNGSYSLECMEFINMKREEHRCNRRIIHVLENFIGDVLKPLENALWGLQWEPHVLD